MNLKPSVCQAEISEQGALPHLPPLLRRTAGTASRAAARSQANRPSNGRPWPLAVMSRTYGRLDDGGREMPGGVIYWSRSGDLRSLLISEAGGAQRAAAA
ncbi:hypothetical protein Acsp04_22250 [Actinomadura sp. NBRC 104425]|nr:hypothetical protein Acsp04_22250 [Actinomadura sp. NBRC 104425]